ncbi:hypothetical protein CH375_00735 [Leptospira ellisii]|uniref:Uncharacterized protein n=1 Tax=Leptospira ellisii TaxID=2023197 RepID=A0A2N0BQK9_9LEPT|nr:hypothetical protein CH379_08035 [Leptospira ellisii]PKA06235.1 hypothetical protein CH375_00735 [Leptospira ellisii]
MRELPHFCFFRRIAGLKGFSARRIRRAWSGSSENHPRRLDPRTGANAEPGVAWPGSFRSSFCFGRISRDAPAAGRNFLFEKGLSPR